MDKLFPVGTHCYHSGHLFGKVIEVRDQSKRPWTNEEMNARMLQARAVDDDNPDNPISAQTLTMKVGMDSLYSGSRYPYKIQFEPRESFFEMVEKCHGPEAVPEYRERYKDGFREVYCHAGMMFSADFKTWHVFDMQEPFKTFTVNDPEDRDEIVLQYMIAMEELWASRKKAV